MKANNWIQQADQAMIRAAARARALAASTQTAIHIMKDGEIVEIRLSKDYLKTTPNKIYEEHNLSVFQEDTPSYRD
jgi:ribosomal protein L21E